MDQEPKDASQKKSSRPPFTKENAKMMSARGNFMRDLYRQWRIDNPNAPLTDRARERQIRDGLRKAAPEVVDAMIDVATDKAHKDFGVMSRVILEHVLGKPKQAVELTGKDGTPLFEREAEIERRIADELNRTAARINPNASDTADSAKP